MTAYEKPSLHMSEMEEIVKLHLGPGATAFTELAGGNLSAVFSFELEGKGYILKFSDLAGAYERERYVSELLSGQGVPFPACMATVWSIWLLSIGICRGTASFRLTWTPQSVMESSFPISARGSPAPITSRDSTDCDSTPRWDGRMLTGARGIFCWRSKFSERRGHTECSACSCDVSRSRRGFDWKSNPRTMPALAGRVPFRAFLVLLVLLLDGLVLDRNRIDGAFAGELVEQALLLRRYALRIVALILLFALSVGASFEFLHRCHLASRWLCFYLPSFLSVSNFVQVILIEPLLHSCCLLTPLIANVMKGKSNRLWR